MSVTALEVQLAKEYEKMFVRQLTELQTLRSKLDEQKKVNSMLEVHLTSAKEIQMTTQQMLNRLVQQVQEQYEEVSTLREQMHTEYAEKNSTALSDYCRRGSLRPMENEQVENMQEYNEARISLVAINTEQQHQLEELPMGTMENEVGSVQEHTQQNCETSSTSSVLDDEQQYQLEELPNPTREANLKQSEGSLRKKQLRLNKKRTAGNERTAKGNARNVKSVSFETTDIQKLPKLKSKMTHIESKTHCKECNRSFSCKSALTVHLRIHTGEKPFTCEICDRSFNIKHLLRQHLMIHTGEKPFVCDLCNQSFRHKSSLSLHMRIHTGDLPYKCERCDSSFNRKYALEEHYMIHTGDTPFVCDVCNTSFRQKITLSCHMRIHTGEKPQNSTVCKKNVSSKI